MYKNGVKYLECNSEKVNRLDKISLHGNNFYSLRFINEHTNRVTLELRSLSTDELLFETNLIYLINEKKENKWLIDHVSNDGKYFMISLERQRMINNYYNNYNWYTSHFKFIFQFSKLLRYKHIKTLFFSKHVKNNVVPIRHREVCADIFKRNKKYQVYDLDMLNLNDKNILHHHNLGNVTFENPHSYGNALSMSKPIDKPGSLFNTIKPWNSLIDHKNWFNNKIYLQFNRDLLGYGPVYYYNFVIRSIDDRKFLKKIDQISNGKIKKHRHYKIKYDYLFLLDFENHLSVYKFGKLFKTLDVPPSSLTTEYSIDYNNILCISDDLKYILLCHCRAGSDGILKCREHQHVLNKKRNDTEYKGDWKNNTCTCILILETGL